MVEFISGKFENIVRKCLEKNAKDFQVDKKEVQLSLKLSEDENVEYSISKMYKKQKNITFLEVLDVRLDFKGYSLFVPKFIVNSLKRISEENIININDLSVMMFTTENNTLNLYVYDGFKPIKPIHLSSLFNTDDIIE